MKRSIIIAVFISLFFSLNAQDLIVTTNGDSLNCKITRSTSDRLYFNTTNINGVVFGIHMPQDQVRVYVRKYYSKDKSSMSLTPGMENPKYFWISFDGGLGYRLGKIDPGLSYKMKSYIEELKNGTFFGVEAILFAGYSSGIGLKYSRFNTSNSIENISITSIHGDTFQGYMEDNISINYFGPGYKIRLKSPDMKYSLTGGVGIGYMGYKDKGVLGSECIITGNTIGISLDVGCIIAVAENFALGFQTSLIGGVLTGYDVDFRGLQRTYKLEKDEYENVGRVDISVRLIIML